MKDIPINATRDDHANHFGDPNPAVSEGSVKPEHSRMSRLEALQATILKATELLPTQGPITAFVFDNTLRGLEDLPFHQAVKRGAELFGCQPYLTLNRFREKLNRGRITDADLSAVLRDDLGESADESVSGLSTRFELRLAMLRYPLIEASAAELEWFVADTDAFRRFLPDVTPQAQEAALAASREAGVITATQHLQTLWEACLSVAWTSSPCVLNGDSNALQAVKTANTARAGSPCYDGVRHRDALLAATNDDSDLLVNEVLIRFTSAFVDQGLAEWVLPHRNEGFLNAFIKLYGRAGGPPAVWMQGLADELDRLARNNVGPLDSIAVSLDVLGVSEAETPEFIARTLLALRGFAGLLWQNETRGDRVPIPVPSGTLMEFLAVRLLLDRIALTHVARERLGFEGALSELRSECEARLTATLWGARERGRDSTSADAPPRGSRLNESDGINPLAFVLFQLAEYLAWPVGKVTSLTDDERQTLVREVTAFDSLERRRVLHLSFEHNYRQRALNAVSIQAGLTAKHSEPQGASRGSGNSMSREALAAGEGPAASALPLTKTTPKFQAVFCIDAREESFRRHLEETDSHVETFGAPGFFCLPIYYRGLGDAHFSTLCPIVVRPQHWVIEEPIYSMTDVEGRRANARRAIGTAGQHVSKASRNMLRGAVITASFGVLASVPLIARVLLPRLTAKIRKHAESLVKPVPVTRLRMERLDEKPSMSESGFGFTVPEMANFGERILRDIGLIKGFARLVMFLGHGSVCQNNPHKSAYDCGACSGMAGQPNARALSAMLNDLRVREILRQRGIDIPNETHFLGGLHNTGDDTVSFADIDFLPRSHRPEFEAAKDILDEACLRNSHERCRRFYSAPLTLTPQEAHLHAEDRTEDLAQVRPEFGNSTNAMCYVGRRSRLAGLFMDRRCFMHSYDHTTDDADATILGRILGAVVFVCSGINLQYMFSYIDSPGWGSGTKLPHNITSLLGVMDGAASDLRTGLPWQGVEIHEPVRLLFVIESTPENLVKIMDRNAVVGRLIRNEWVQLAILNPESNELMHFKHGKFEKFVPDATELPTVVRSQDWYRGQREHLGFARVQS